MKFTVLGGHGVIGQSLVASLRESDYSVSVLGRDDAWDPSADWGHAIYAVGMTADFRTRPFETVDAGVAKPKPPLTKPVIKKPPNVIKKDPKQPKVFDPNRPLPRR